MINFFPSILGAQKMFFNAKELTVFATTTHTYTHNALTHFLPGKQIFGTTATCNIFKEKKRNALILDSK